MNRANREIRIVIRFSAKFITLSKTAVDAHRGLPSAVAWNVTLFMTPSVSRTAIRDDNPMRSSPGDQTVAHMISSTAHPALIEVP